MTEDFVLCEELLMEIQRSRIKFDDEDRYFFISINDNYLDLKYCPFCGKKLIKKEVKL